MKPDRRRQGIKKLKRMLKVYNNSHLDRYSLDDKCAKIWLYTRVPCSCFMCGNRRRHEGVPTVQERKSNESMKDQLRDAS